jgi:hypothetical protein
MVCHDVQLVFSSFFFCFVIVVVVVVVAVLFVGLLFFVCVCVLFVPLIHVSYASCSFPQIVNTGGPSVNQKDL